MKPRLTDALREEIERGVRWCSFHGQTHPRAEFGDEVTGGRQRWCRRARREYMRAWREEKGDAETSRLRYATDREYREKVKARARLGQKIRRGTLERPPCEECGADEAQGHHEDYERDIVRWLCQKCHKRLHRSG